MTTVRAEDRGPVRHVVMDRPEKRNAMNGELVEGLTMRLEEAANDPGVLCVIVRGEGPSFSAGIDLEMLAQMAGTTEQLGGFRGRMLRAFNLCEEMAKPTIAQIHGSCLGAAMELALACDLRVMAADGRIGLLETKVGLIPDVGGSSRLPSVVGVGRAKEMIMTSKVIDGVEAERIGLANRVAPAAQLESATDQLTAELLQCSPVPVGLVKRVIDAAAKPALALTLEQELVVQQLCVASHRLAAATSGSASDLGDGALERAGEASASAPI